MSSKTRTTVNKWLAQCHEDSYQHYAQMETALVDGIARLEERQAQTGEQFPYLPAYRRSLKMAKLKGVK